MITMQVFAKDQAGGVGNQVAELNIGAFENSKGEARYVVTSASSKALRPS